MSDSAQVRQSITETREAVLAQQLHEVDKLTDKIVGVAERIERATAAVTSAQRTESPSPTPRTAQEDADKRPSQQSTTWPTRRAKLGVMAALLVVCAVISAGTARLMPMNYGGQALDLRLASEVKHQIAQEGGTGLLWNALRPEVRNAALAAMGH